MPSLQDSNGNDVQTTEFVDSNWRQGFKLLLLNFRASWNKGYDDDDDDLL